MPIKLRGHHLICLHFFPGHDAESKELLKKLLSKGRLEGVTVVDGVDDYCVECKFQIDGVCKYKEGAEEHIRELDYLALNLLNLSILDNIDFSDLREQTHKILDKWKALVCSECDWKSHCNIGYQV